MPKDNLVKHEIGEIVFNLLTDALTPLVHQHQLTGTFLVMITSDQGLDGDCFMAPFFVTPSSGQSSNIEQLAGIDYLKKGASIAKDIEAAGQLNRGVRFVLDQKTAKNLCEDKEKPITLIAYDEHHCLLTGLKKGLDVYIAGGTETLISAGKIRLIRPSS